jgi:hypothetical protein
MPPRQSTSRPTLRGFFARLARDAAGNTLMIVAASIAPILAMVGGGIDMGRSYLAESRLQQACDAGVLAARKKLGSAAVVTGVVPTDVSDIGARFFNINYRLGAYGTKNRQFAMTLEDDYSISGTASADVPTTIMGIFGFTKVAVAAECQARLNFSNTDVMMVLDTTGSMAETNPGDSLPKIVELRSTVTSFFSQLEASKKPGTRVRYGFVPYSTNVNVGALLKDDWVVKDWSYQSRLLDAGGAGGALFSYYTASSLISGSRADTVASTYAATFSRGAYTCPTRPANTLTSTTVRTAIATQAMVGPPAGTRTTETYRRTRNGNAYSVSLGGTTCTVNKAAFASYVDEYQKITEPSLSALSTWSYQPVARSVADWRTASNGCIEERKTYEIADYDSVDLGKAKDLDIDLVPTVGNADTQWRPMYPALVYDRAIKWNGTGSFSTAAVTTHDEYVNPGLAGYAACPPAAAKLQSYTLGGITSYLASLSPRGSTYHDIGMIWGGRLLSPTGIFADENADESSSKPTSRNLIFLTDGQTAPLDVSYGSYGVEPLEKKRWSPASSRTLAQTVEARFTFACQEVRKKNITIWLIALGTELNPVMSDCAGPGHAFEAANAAGLNQAFDDIAKSIGDLRIAR